MRENPHPASHIIDFTASLNLKKAFIPACYKKAHIGVKLVNELFI
jgi:hypothetical protein